MTKIEVLEFLKLPNLISRKILVAVKTLDFQTVYLMDKFDLHNTISYPVLPTLVEVPFGCFDIRSKKEICSFFYITQFTAVCLQVHDSFLFVIYNQSLGFVRTISIV